LGTIRRKSKKRFSKSKIGDIILLMDARKRQIEILEKNKQESRFSLDSLLECLGEKLLGRIKEAPADYNDVTEYFRLQKDITDSNTAIQGVEEQIRLLKKLEGQIEEKEQEDRERAKELTVVFCKMGKALLEDTTGSYVEFIAPFREQADALITKVNSLENRSANLEQKDGNNVFSWIGKSAQGLVLRSFLNKAQENLEQLYRNIGDAFSRHEGFEGSNAPEAVAGIVTEIKELHEQIKVLSEELAKLKEEKRAISTAFDVEGNPNKQIQALKNHIGQVKEELRTLYRNFGAQAALPDSSNDLSAQRKEFVSSLVTADEQEIIDNAGKLKQTIHDNEEAIGKLRASLAIDVEKTKIEKCHKTILEKRLRITEAERAIVELETEIKDSEKHIEELQKLL